MENRCQRCNRKLSDPNAQYGWRCAEILGISSEFSNIDAVTFKKITDGVMKAESLFGKSNIQFTDERRKNLYSAFAKMSLWEGIDEKKVKQAKEEIYSIVNGVKTKTVEFAKTLDEYYKNNIKDTPVHSALNVANDTTWKTGAVVLDKAGYDLSSDLLKLAASGSGNKYVAKEGSYASELLKNDKGLNDFVKSKIEEYAKKYKSPHLLIKDESYEIPLGNGDLGTALHNINIDIDARRGRDGKWNAEVKVRDDFDFTEWVDPFDQDSIKEGVLWFANDVATASSELGLLDEVGVEITYSKKY